jgi:hypothetical protein
MNLIERNPMFKNRKITVTVDKKNPDEAPTPEDLEIFEHRADIILHKFDKIVVKVMVGVCAYVLLDTFRQIAVNQNTYIPEEG